MANNAITEEWRIRYTISDRPKIEYTDYENEKAARTRFSSMKKCRKYSFIQLLYYPFGPGEELVDEVLVSSFKRTSQK